MNRYPDFDSADDQYGKQIALPSKSPKLARTGEVSDSSISPKHRDAKLVGITKAHHDGTYGVLPSSHPAVVALHAPGAVASSHELLFGRKQGEPRDLHEKSPHDGR